MVERSLCMREARGSIPRISIRAFIVPSWIYLVIILCFIRYLKGKKIQWQKIWMGTEKCSAKNK